MGYGNSQGHDDSQDGTHAMIDKLEHELGTLELTDHMMSSRFEN